MRKNIYNTQEKFILKCTMEAIVKTLTKVEVFWLNIRVEKSKTWKFYITKEKWVVSIWFDL